MDRLITLTPERLLKAQTPRGGYNSKQLKYLGLDWLVSKGWKNSLLGKKILGKKIQIKGSDQGVRVLDRSPTELN